MTTRELTEKLASLPEVMQILPVYVQDGLDPSDPCEAKRIVLHEEDHRGPTRLELE